MANLCRSPMAQAVIDGIAKAQRLSPIGLDSAGVRVAWQGRRPDPRAEATLVRGGYTPIKGRARQLSARDFERFDLLLAMDRFALEEMKQIGAAEHMYKAHLFLDFAPGLEGQDVPDPYFGTAEGFQHVLALCEAGAHGMLRTLFGGEGFGAPALP
jgi:protein-tyrosine phosphatase